MKLKPLYISALLSVLLLSSCGAEDLLTKKKMPLDSKIAETNQRYEQLNALLLQADQALQTDNIAEAKRKYLEAQALDSNHPRVKDGLKQLEMFEHHQLAIAEAKNLFDEGDYEKAKLKIRPVLLENPSSQDARAVLQAIEEKNFQFQSTPKKLNPKLSKTVTLEFKDAGLQNVFQVISMTTGINFVLDPLVRQDLKASIFVKNASVEEAIDFLLMIHDLRKKVLTDTSVLIYPANRASQYDDLLLRSFYLNQAEAKQTLTLIKQMIPITEGFVDEKLNMITLKATYNQLRDAERLIVNEDIAEPEVVLDVEVMEVTQSKLTDMGATLPSSVSVLGASTGGAITWNELSKLNGTNIGLSPSLTLNLLRKDGDTNVLANPRIRVRSREKAKIHIGDRIPIQSTTTSGTTAAFVGTTATYLDVGLKLEVEPRVMLNNDVSIKLNLEVSSASVPAGASYPTISTRNTATVLMTGDGETQVLAGLINNQSTKSSNKVPGMADLPLVGRLFTDVNSSKSKTEIILLITPHVVRNIMRPDAKNAEFYGGTGARSGPVNFNPLSVLQQFSGVPRATPATPAAPVAPAAAASPPATSAAPPPTLPGGVFVPGKPAGF